MKAPKFADIHAVAFDLDGTLLDSAPDLAFAVNQTLLALGKPTVSLPQVAGWIGNGIEVLVKRALSDSFDICSRLSQQECQTAIALFKEHYADALHGYSKLYPNVLDVLSQLKEADIKVAVVTNKARQFAQPLVEQFGMSAFVDLLVCGDCLPEKKPSPLPLTHCLQQFGLLNAQMVMVGDSRNDIQAAKAASIPVIGLTYGYNYGEDIALSSPDAVIDDLGMLPDLLGMRSLVA
ncbi:phosphoglycolate phosphatase [Corallincola platygyrae]